MQLVTEGTPLWRASEDTLAHLQLEAPYWAYAWAGGLGVARYVLDNPDLVRGKHVVDFATGCGLAAIAAAKAGAARVVATEIDPMSIDAARLNAELNAVTLELALADIVGDPCRGVDVLLAGDVFYATDIAERCRRWFETLARRGVLVLVGDPGRAYLPREHMTLRAQYDLPDSPHVEDEGVRKSTVFAVTDSALAP